MFLASQVFVIMNSFKPATKRSPSSHLLGVGEFELFDVFERWRTPLASWLRAHPTEAAVAMENIERVVTCKGTADITAPDANRSWREMPNEPGNWASRPSTEGQEAVPGESYREWLLRTYHQASAGGADIVVSVNQGRYHCRDAGLQLLPEHALRSPHLLEACKPFPSLCSRPIGDTVCVSFRPAGTWSTCKWCYEKRPCTGLATSWWAKTLRS